MDTMDNQWLSASSLPLMTTQSSISVEDTPQSLYHVYVHVNVNVHVYLHDYLRLHLLFYRVLSMITQLKYMIHHHHHHHTAEVDGCISRLKTTVLKIPILRIALILGLIPLIQSTGLVGVRPLMIKQVISTPPPPRPPPPPPTYEAWT